VSRLLFICPIVAALLLLVASCGGDTDETTTDARHASSAGPVTVDWRDGTLDGVGLRSKVAAVVRALGPPERRGFQNPASPIGEDYYAIGGPTSFGLPFSRRVRPDQLGYTDLTIFTARDRVYAWVTTSERARTPEDVGVGDTRQRVEQRYPRADCYTANEGTDYPTFPLCEVRVCEKRTLYFGADPIRSIWLVAENRGGLTTCADPETPTG
jgi:hypothetical protein